MHRLDKDTSGVLLLARDDDTLRHMNTLFATGAIRKTYLAMVIGVPASRRGLVECDFEKTKVGGKWKFLPTDSQAPTASTSYEVLDHKDLHASLLRLQPRTGRQHQLRVHCAGPLLCPILGDTLYGPGTNPWLHSTLCAEMPTVPMHLHALRLVVPNFWPGKACSSLVVEAPLPDHFRTTLRLLGLSLTRADNGGARDGLLRDGGLIRGGMSD